MSCIYRYCSAHCACMYAQGVAWDPRGRYLSTQSSDRTVRIYKAARSQPAVKKETAQEESGVSVPATAPSPAKVVYSKLVTANVISSAPGVEAKVRDTSALIHWGHAYIH